VNWFALLGPAGMPKDIVDRLAAATNKVVQTEDFKKRMHSLFAWPMVKNADEFAEIFEKDRQRWRELIEGNNLKIE